jgi:cytochrome bd-type quinol oxidase subunit 2
MSTALVLVVLSITGAVYLYRHKPTDETHSSAWNEGYKAGFLTPGPFTIIGLFGAGYLMVKH